jgi:hypothetical protein
MNASRFTFATHAHLQSGVQKGYGHATYSGYVRSDSLMAVTMKLPLAGMWTVYLIAGNQYFSRTLKDVYQTTWFQYFLTSFIFISLYQTFKQGEVPVK